MRDVAEAVRVSQKLRVVRAVDVARPDTGLAADAPNLAAHRKLRKSRERECDSAERPACRGRKSRSHHVRKCTAINILLTTKDAGISHFEQERICTPKLRRRSMRCVA